MDPAEDLFAILLTPLVGKKVGQWDPRRMATGAFIVFSTVLWMRSQFTVQTDFIHILIPTLLQGAAMAFFFIPLSTIIFSGLTPDKIASASGLSSFARIVGGSFGTSIAVTIWQDRAAMHHAQLAELVNRGSVATNAALANFSAAGMSAEQLDQIFEAIGELEASCARHAALRCSTALSTSSVVPRSSSSVSAGKPSRQVVSSPCSAAR